MAIAASNASIAASRSPSLTRSVPRMMSSTCSRSLRSLPWGLPVPLKTFLNPNPPKAGVG